MGSLGDFGPRAGRTGPAAERLLREYAAAADPALRTTGDEAVETLRLLREANPGGIAPSPGADYPAAPIGQRLKQIAQLIKADVGLEVAFADVGGWDTRRQPGAA